MLRLVLYFVGVALVASGLSWLADRPGLIVFNWEGYEGEISVFHAVVGLTFLLGLAILLWSLFRAIWNSPATVGEYFYRRRQKRGLDALSSGIIAIGAGDGANAMRHAVQARKTLPNEPLTHLLRAQAAQLSGDKTTTRRIFEAMLAQPDTEQLGLRGLFLEARREGEDVAATQFAERALKLNPKLAWAADALFELQCKAENWSGALQTLSLAKKHGLVDKAVADQRRAVLLTAQAQRAEDLDADRGLTLALEAHNLAPGLIPAAAIAGRILASRGNTAKAAKVLQKTWLKSPHPDLAAAYAYARVGDSPKDRLERVRQLANMQQNSIESPIAIARVAIEAKAFDEAREALDPLLDDRLTQRVATLMARIEAEEKGDAGRVREWLARAVSAARDPVWTADGVVSENWAPVSPVTGELDAFQWRVPVEALESADNSKLIEKLAEMAALGAPIDAIDARPVASSSSAAASNAAVSGTPPSGAKAEASVPEAAPQSEPKQAEPEPEAPSTGVASAPTATATAAAAAKAPLQQPETVAPSQVNVDGAPARKDTGTDVVAVAVSPKSGGPASDSAKPLTAGASRSPAAGESVARVGVAKSSSAGSDTVSPDTDASCPNKTAEPTKPNKAEPQIFVSPRAPDDPGPDAGDSDLAEVRPLIPRYGTTR